MKVRIPGGTLKPGAESPDSVVKRFDSPHYIVELGIIVGKGGRDILRANADDHIAGYSTSFSNH